MSVITSPEKFFGRRPGDDNVFIGWEEMCSYYKKLETESDRIKVRVHGKSTEGHDFVSLYISDEENLDNLDRIFDISKRVMEDETISEEELSALVSEGKSVVYHTYSMHSNEVSGAQATPIIVYELLTAKPGSELYKALYETVFIMTPCAEPDGLEIFRKWHEKYLGTEFEGFCSPYLRHTLAGHCNWDDAIHEKLVESQYMNDILIREACPQIYQDFHQQYSWDARMSLGAVGDPLLPCGAALANSEGAICGAVMQTELFSHGRAGIEIFGDQYSDFPPNSPPTVAKMHNIIGLLAECAGTRTVSPIVVDSMRHESYKFPTSKCAIPWEGGEWHLSDNVLNVKLATLAIIKHAARNKDSLLRNMVIKARMQTERGEKSEKHTLFIPMLQNDESALRGLIRILLNHNIRVYKTTEDISIDLTVIPKGSYAVPLAQPKYGIISLILDDLSYPKNEFLYNPDGTPRVRDMAAISASLLMGVRVVPANRKVPLSVLSRISEVEGCEVTLPLSAKLNSSYAEANRLLAGGTQLYRDAEGNFHTENGDGRYEVRRSRVAVYDRSDSTGNMEEGFAKNVLLSYGFDMTVLRDRDIRKGGIPKDIDVLIFTGDTTVQITDGDDDIPHTPEEYVTGIGSKGVAELIEFVRRGGRVIGYDRSCHFLNECFELNLINRTAGLGPKEYGTFGSLLRTRLIDKNNELCLGMPERFDGFYYSNAVLYPRDVVGRCTVLARIEKENILKSGFITGEKLLEDAPALIRYELDNGDVLLYSFNPTFRGQVDGAFKMLFNALYSKTVKAPDKKTIRHLTHHELPRSFIHKY